jgi:diacylglycerol kinase family enzyme
VLDVVNIAPSTLAGWLAVAVRVITRRRGGHERVEHWQARSILIESAVPQPSQLDGDPIGETTRLHIQVDPASLVMRVPVPPSPDAPDPG